MKMKKNWAMVGVSLAVILTGLLVGLAACQTGMEDSLSLSTELPIGAIVQNADTGTYSFRLTWHREAGDIVPGAKYLDQGEVVAAIDRAYQEWATYTRIINPLPFYDTVGDGLAPDIAGGGKNAFLVAEDFSGYGLKIDNEHPEDDGRIVIHRYWPKVTIEATGEQYTPSREDWLKTAGARAVAFKKAAAGIEGMIAAINASPLSANETLTVPLEDGAEMEVSNPLIALRDSMQEYISYNPPNVEDCVQRDGFDWDRDTISIRASVALHPGTSGPLFEYYLGHAPWPIEYRVTTGPYALPED